MRFGVIGFGLRGHLAELAHRPDQGREVVALADPNPAANLRLREQVNADAICVADYRALLDQDLDAVFVLSPDFLHEEHAATLLDAGVPVYLEKPMATTIAGCDAILAAARRTGTKLYLGHNMRWFAVVRKMKEWIDQGLIGKVQTAWCRHFISYGGEAYYRDWHADRSKSGGLLVHKGSHDIDVLHWLCGGYTRRVTALGKLAVYGEIADRQAPDANVAIEFKSTWPPSSLTQLYPTVDVEDVSLMTMELDNGVLASYQQCHFAPDAWRNYTIIGDRGRIENFGDAPGKATVRLFERPPDGYSDRGDLEYHVPPASGPHGGSDAKILDEFVRYLSDGGETDTSPVAARMAVAAGVCGTESVIRRGEPVDVPPIS